MVSLAGAIIEAQTRSELLESLQPRNDLGAVVTLDIKYPEGEGDAVVAELKKLLDESECFSVRRLEVTRAAG